MEKHRLIEPEVEEVKFMFDPEASTDKIIRAIFADPIAKALWIGVKKNHLVNQYFDGTIINMAHKIGKRKTPLTADDLNHMLKAAGVIGSNENEVGAYLLPFVSGDKVFKIILPEDGLERH